MSYILSRTVYHFCTIYKHFNYSLTDLTTLKTSLYNIRGSVEELGTEMEKRSEYQCGWFWCRWVSVTSEKRTPEEAPSVTGVVLFSLLESLYKDN